MYYLNKIVWAIVNPFAIGMLLAVAGIVFACLRRRKTCVGLLVSAVAWLWFWSTPLVSDTLGTSLESEFPPESVEQLPQADAIILLGGGIDKNGQLPDAVKARCKTAIDYMKSNPNAILITTGGALKNLPAEAPATKEYLINQGLEADRILIEPNARDTIQNFQYSCKVLSEYYNCPQSQILNSDVLIVTSFFHLARSQRLARRMGFTRTTGLGSRTPAIKLLDAYSREICAYIKLNLRILLTGKPKKIEA